LQGFRRRGHAESAVQQELYADIQTKVPVTLPALLQESKYQHQCRGVDEFDRERSIELLFPLGRQWERWFEWQR